MWHMLRWWSVLHQVGCLASLPSHKQHNLVLAYVHAGRRGASQVHSKQHIMQCLEQQQQADES